MRAADDENQELKPFLEHLEDLRTTLIRCAAVLAISMVVVAPFLPWVMRVLKLPLAKVVKNPDQFLQLFDITGGFMLAMNMAFWTGVTVSSPFLLIFIGQFIFPALKRSEQRVVLRAGGFALGLFLVGALIGYFFMLPFAIDAMLGVNRWMQIQPQWLELRRYIVFCLQLVAASGLAFEMPVVLAVLGRFGVINTTQLRGKRRHAIVAILIIAAILSPPDGLTMWILAVPLYILYEGCIWLIWGWEREKAALAARGVVKPAKTD
jgi:sec-independent protein translocase protein TatC